MLPKNLARALCSTAIALSLAAFACSSDGTDADHVCNGICANVPDCAGVSCVSTCIALEATCTIAGEQSLFQAWVSCGPSLVCASGSYQSTNCAHESAGALKCGAVVLGDDASEPTGDGSSTSGHDGGNVPHDGGGGSETGSSQDGGMGDETALEPDGSTGDDGGPSPALDASHDANPVPDASPDTSITHDSGPEASPHDSGPEASAHDSGSEAGACVTGASDTTCSGLATTACVTCCKSHHCTGSALYATLYEPCVCDTGGVCSADCATDFCSTGIFTAGSLCDACATDNNELFESCFDDADETCRGESVDCGNYTTCIDTYCGE